jgi:hypothetical protein
MENDVPRTVFLAGSTVELISALACLVGLKTDGAAVFVEHNISFKTAAMKPLLAAARVRFSGVRFIELEIDRPDQEEHVGIIGIGAFIRRWKFARSIQRQLDQAIRTHYGIDLATFGGRVQEICFTTILHDYVLVFLSACRMAKRVFYPHGFDHPRGELARDYDYQVRRRSVRTLIQTLPKQMKHFGWGGMALGGLGHLLPGITTTAIPFSGVDQVLTFRADVDFIPNETVRVGGLAEIFQWLLELSPWVEALRYRNARVNGRTVLLLLPETNNHPIWEKNRNFGLSHLRLLQSMSRMTGSKRFVIKAHVRSDGSAAGWLAGFLKRQEPSWEIEILPSVLHGLPVEALAMTGEFAAGCSLGSCSLPPGLGFGIPHYASRDASALFDDGWCSPFWLKYSDAAQMLINEGICIDLEKQTL